MATGLPYFLFCVSMRMSECITTQGGLTPAVSKAMMLRESQFPTKVIIFVLTLH